jgi:pimeloyl-ACP methyl ester carboxylesterase
MKKAEIIFVMLICFCFSAASQTTTSLSIRGQNQELHVYGTPANPPIILGSGDLGWAGLVVHVAELLAQNGYYVIGLNDKVYLTSFTSKTSTLSAEDVPKDYLTLMEYARRSNATNPVLAGISEGAGLSVLAATDPQVKQGVRGILALGLPDQNELGWKWRDFTIWITKKVPHEPSFRVSEIINKVSPVPLAEIHATHDEFLSIEKAKDMIALAGEPKRMWIIEADNHRFSNARNELDRAILEALTWINQHH